MKIYQPLRSSPPAHASPPQAFTLIDTNRDGFIDKVDLAEMLSSLGKRFSAFSFISSNNKQQQCNIAHRPHQQYGFASLFSCRPSC